MSPRAGFRSYILLPQGSGRRQWEDTCPRSSEMHLFLFLYTGSPRATPPPSPSPPTLTGTSWCSVEPQYLRGRDAGMLELWAPRREGRKEGRRGGRRRIPTVTAAGLGPRPGGGTGPTRGLGSVIRSPGQPTLRQGMHGCPPPPPQHHEADLPLCRCLLCGTSLPSIPAPLQSCTRGKLSPPTPARIPSIPNPVPEAPLRPLRAALSLQDKGEGVSATLPVCPVTLGVWFIPHPVTGSPGPIEQTPWHRAPA